MPKRKIFIFVIIAAIAAIGIWLIFFNKKAAPVSAPPNFYTISDGSTGLTFNVSKNFKPIPKAELSAMNPGFSYGFRPEGDSRTSCIASQSALHGSGTLTGAQLRDGILKEVKKVHPDVKLTNPATAPNPVKFGDGLGILLQLTFKEDKLPITRVEILALGETTQVIAYCQSPSKDNAKYYDDFTIFFSSIRILRQP